MTNGAGNYATWIHRYYRFRQFGTQAAPTSGSMGYGLPAAVGIKRAFPNRVVVSVAGDGCFMMNGQEFATAVQYELPIVVLIVDNGYHHFVVVKGMRDNKILLGDPAVGMRVMARDQFEASWPNRIVFVIHDAPARGEFNTARDWSVRPRSPLGRPLGADTLNSIILFRPGAGDF